MIWVKMMPTLASQGTIYFKIKPMMLQIYILYSFMSNK